MIDPFFAQAPVKIFTCYSASFRVKEKQVNCDAFPYYLTMLLCCHQEFVLIHCENFSGLVLLIRCWHFISWTTCSLLLAVVSPVSRVLRVQRFLSKESCPRSTARDDFLFWEHLQNLHVHNQLVLPWLLPVAPFQHRKLFGNYLANKYSLVSELSHLCRWL